jgi:hypothetical protein
MKKLNHKIIALGSIVFFTAVYSCKKALDKSPAGVLAGSSLANKAGVDGLLIGAYSLLDGYYQGQSVSNYGSGISNWSFGDIGADDSYKGSTTVDQAPDAPAIEQHASIATSNGYVDARWVLVYGGVARANNVLQEIPLVVDGSESASITIQSGTKSVTETVGVETAAEATFLRAVYHFEAAKIWRNVPYVDEKVTYVGGNYNVPNPGPIWDKIETDFSNAMAALPNTQAQAGRANFYAAEAFLAKAYVYDHKYALALPLLTDCIANGETAGGAKYGLGHFEDNFNASTKNNQESVFACQMSVNDGSGGNNDDGGDILNFPGGGTYTSCCGFHIPSYNLANAFQVDASGLPMFTIDATTGFPTYNVTNLPNDHGVAATDAYTPTTVAVDSRLDWTVGRRGIPYLDWGLCGGEPWTRGDLAPYTPKKHSFYEAAASTTTDAAIWGATGQGSAINYVLIRFADVLLFRAECEIATGDLADAEKDVNTVRARAADPTGWVHTYLNNSNPQAGNSSVAAANYNVGLYTGQFAANGAAWAWGALMIERQLEFGTEGQRFFDLQRMDAASGGPLGPKGVLGGAGYMASVLNTYYKSDTRIPNPVLSSANFTVGRDEFYPLPQAEIDKEGGALKQNSGGY